MLTLKLKWMSYCVSLLLILSLTACMTATPKTSQKVGQITKPQNESIQVVIKSRLGEVQECYDSQIKRGLRKSGKLVVTWFVDSQGKPSQFDQEMNELGSAELYDCTTTAIQAWPFPKNQATLIRYTFKMRAAEKQPAQELTSVDELGLLTK